MNKTLLVTAASSEVGVQYIQNYHMHYGRIIGLYRTSSAQLEQLEKSLEGKLVLIKADFMRTEEIQNVIVQLKEENLIPDCVLHLPSLKYELNKFHKIPYSRFTEQMQVQVYSAVLMLQAFLPVMAKRKYGRVVLMLSSAIKDDGQKYLTDYSIAKYALLGLVKSLSAEYADKGILVNGISPGMMETKLLSETSEHLLQQNAQENPQKRNTRVEDVLPAIDYFLSEATNFVTGQNLKISGGQ